MNNFFDFTKEEIWSIYRNYDLYNKDGAERLKADYIKHACRKLNVAWSRYRRVFAEYYDSYKEAQNDQSI